MGTTLTQLREKYSTPAGEVQQVEARLYLGVDFGAPDDKAMSVTVRKELDGTFTILDIKEL